MPTRRQSHSGFTYAGCLGSPRPAWGSAGAQAHRGSRSVQTVPYPAPLSAHALPARQGERSQSAAWPWPRWPAGAPMAAAGRWSVPDRAESRRPGRAVLIVQLVPRRAFVLEPRRIWPPGRPLAPALWPKLAMATGTANKLARIGSSSISPSGLLRPAASRRPPASSLSQVHDWQADP